MESGQPPLESRSKVPKCPRALDSGVRTAFHHLATSQLLQSHPGASFAAVGTWTLWNFWQPVVEVPRISIHINIIQTI